MNILATVTETDYNTDGSLPQGFLFGSVKNIGNQTIIVNGVGLPSGQAKAYPFVGKGYPEVSFQVNGSILQVMMIV